MALLVISSQIGCATRRPAPAAVTVSDAERAACQALVRAESTAAERAAKEAAAREAAAQPGPSGVEVVGDIVALGLLAPFLPYGVLGYLMTEPFNAIGRARATARAREAAVNDCLGYVIQAATLGPDDPAVANSLVALAIRQSRVEHPAEAEAYFGRALAIYERNALETDPGGRVEALGSYARFLRGRGRDTEAGHLDARARATRDMFGPKPRFTPSSHDFGPVEVGATSPPVTFTLTNTGDRPFESRGATTGIANIQSDACTNVTVPSGGTCTIVLHFAPFTAGAQEQVLQVSVTGSGLDAIAEASLTGTGVAPPTPKPAGGPTP
jgi:hypothetical protein